MVLQFRGPTFPRVMVLAWLMTWMLADPLSLLQFLNSQGGLLSPYPVLTNAQTTINYSVHHSDVVLSEFSQGDANRKLGAHSFTSASNHHHSDRTLLASIRHAVPERGPGLILLLAGSVPARASPLVFC